MDMTTDSRHCRYRSAAWRRRLVRPWTLVRTLIPSDHILSVRRLNKVSDERELREKT